MRPLISVFINTYNHERYVEQAIVSVLEQDFPAAETEILVVDDGSTDRTPAVIRKFVPQVRYLRKENGGQISAFNAALPELRGDIVAFLDGDDWWAQQKLFAVAEAFVSKPEIAAVGHAYYDVRECTPTEIVAPEKTSFLDISTLEAAREADAATTLLATSRLSVRKRVLERIGPLPLEAIFFDSSIFTLSFALGGAVVLEEPLGYYRLHSSNLYSRVVSDTATWNRRMAVLAFRLKYIPSRLAEFGVSPDIIELLMEPRRIEYNRMRLQFGAQSGRWEVFRTENQRFRITYKRPTIGYRFFQCAVGACALSLPPRHFYRLLDWYGRNNLKRLRGVFGTPEPRVPASFVRRSHVSNASS